jgi:hypothetical protein
LVKLDQFSGVVQQYLEQVPLGAGEVHSIRVGGCCPWWVPRRSLTPWGG